eukprot:1773967-Karenia_brevis.AAC.1
MVPLQEGKSQSAMDLCSLWVHFSASSNPFCVGMKTGPSPQDLLIVRAVVPNHKDLATIQMFNNGQLQAKKHAFSGATQQFTDTEIADLIKDMIG